MSRDAAQMMRRPGEHGNQFLANGVIPSQRHDRAAYMKWHRWRSGTQPLPTCPVCGSAFPFVHRCHADG